jgi:trk system potassium uptake protein TrkA
VKLLKDADVARADRVLAVSGEDDVNLVAAQLARTFGVGSVLARLNDPASRQIFKALVLQRSSPDREYVSEAPSDLDALGHLPRTASKGGKQ